VIATGDPTHIRLAFEDTTHSSTNLTGALLGRGNLYSPDLFYLISGVVPLEVKVATQQLEPTARVIV
jgi:hypothetical protein